MANSIITNSMIALESIRLWKNQNALLNMVRQQYNDEFARTGAKAGTSIRIRLPVEYSPRSGPTAVIQDTVENVRTLTVASQAGVDMSFSSVDRTMALDDFMERYIRPAVNTTAGIVAQALMAGSEGGASSWAALYDVSGNILAPNMQTYLQANAVLRKQAVPTQDKYVVNDPITEANAVNSFASLYNSAPRISKQYETGEMFSALGFDWMSDNTVLVHTPGTLATSPTWVAGSGWSFGTVAGANQTGSAITTAALTGTLAQGDIIRIAGVNAVNAITKASTGALQTFTVTAPVSAGATSIPIYPALTPANAGNNPNAYQTVTASPANSAVIYSVAKASVPYRKNLAFHPDAITLAIIDLEGNLEGAAVSRKNQDGVSIRVASQWNYTTDQQATRLDILYGLAFLKPEWIVVIPDPVV